MEIETKPCTLLRNHLQKCIAGHCFNVVFRIADRGAKQNAILFHQIHGLHNRVIMALTPSCVIGLRCALNGQLEGQIAQTDNLLTECLINQGRVGIDGKLHIIVLFCQL